MSRVGLINFKREMREITEYYKKLIRKTKENVSIGGINEWLIDNYYIISEQEKNISDEYLSKVMKQMKGKRKKALYALIYNILKTNDFQVKMPSLIDKLNIYQEETKDYFSYYEINVIYTYIKVVLISELNVLCKRLDERLNEKADVDHLFTVVANNIGDESFELEKYIDIDEEMIKHPYYIEELNYKLKELGVLADAAFVKLNELLKKENLSLRELIEQSHNEMASDNFLMINLFGSLKKVSKYKIEDLYKNTNYAEKTLISENANVYNNIFDNSKREYREKIILNARKRNISEYEYTKEIVETANKEKQHVGWYLSKPKNYMFRARIYILVILLLTFILSFEIAKHAGMISFFILLVPISGLVIESITQILMHYDNVNSLFKVKFDDGLPKEFSTMVVIPTLLSNKKKVQQMFDSLELYYLSNKTDNLYFTLLGDCTSEKVKDVEVDKEIIEAGLSKVSELNEKYGKNIFYFVYRNRFYNEGEECFLGFERKRGALHHFNKLLLNKLTDKEKKEYFNCHTFSNLNVPIKYVITLDTDTKLVLNTAFKLIGAMAHPLNRPVLSEEKDKVVSGYGIMQTRINVDVEVTSKSKYSQLFAGLGGLDIYTTASFDLYQDIFNEGSFVGKGIYDLEVFDQVLGDAFPNNLILSHDLLEGNYLRCGFINDVELFDDYPSAYLNDASRHHRWNRGDWQIIGWLKKKVKNAKGETVNNPISILSKWKIFDNLRRSLLSPFLLLLIFYGFTIGNGNASAYLILVSIIIMIPIFFYLISKILYRNKYDMFLKYYLNLIKGVFAVINKSLIVLAVLPYEAYLYIDSIIKALYRMFISKKRLLNWITAEEVEKTLKNNLSTYMKAFRTNYLCAVLLIVLAVIFKPTEIELACVIAIIWFLAPVLLFLISRNLVEDNKDLDKRETAEIMNVATQTWSYFDDLICEEYNYLIPDNYQLNREEKVDHKTSPTNIGFSIVSVVSVFELGLINSNKAVTMISNIVKSVEKLEKWNGLLYNWYNIYTMRKMHPYFISTVDTGNLLACLYVAKSFLEKQGNRETLFRVEKLIEEMDFTKLYNKDLDVFSIGYNYSEQTLLSYHYNNFASEARLTSFISIAKGNVPYKHWFCLDKALTKYKRYKGVASWSGTAFEYFMPLIFMKTYQHTLLDETYYYAYFAQREFIREIDPDLPWGISESAYNELDDSQNYKYNSFGIPYLKFQESASYPIVISPYSSIMAIGIDDREVYDNINKLKKLNMYGKYGFFEAYDYDDDVVIKNYYAHHQGMILASLTNYLKDNVIQEHFHDDKTVQSIEMLLKEKVQIKTYIDLKIAKYKKYQYSKEKQENDMREVDTINQISELGVLSNGFYSVLLNDRGNGFSKYKNLQINRFRKVSDDDYGLFLYIRNLNNNKVWSNTYAPLNVKPNNYKVTFASDRIKYLREDDNIITSTEITVVKDYNAELRKVTFQNNSNNDVTLEVTSYGEVIMSRNDEDVAHRAFNGLTILSEIDQGTSSLIFSRKSRTKGNTRYYVINRMFMEDEKYDSFLYETSRANFIGRNRTLSNPDLIVNKKDLSKLTGASLDPIMSIRKRITIKAKEKVKLYILVGFGKSREQVMEIVNEYKDEFSIDRAFDMATVLNNIRTKYANLNANQMRLYNTMLKYIFQSLPSTEERKKLLASNQLSQEGLWKFGISGDWPIILIEIDEIEDIGFVKEALQAYEFYKVRALAIDFIIINNNQDINEKAISEHINLLLYQINNSNNFEGIPGDVFLVSSSNISKEERVLLNLVASISLNASSSSSFAEQTYNLIDEVKLISNKNEDAVSLEVALPKDVELYNGYGGFTNVGREYILDKIDTPTPWVNVIANDNFGTIVSNNMGGFTYAYNSREFKLTSWSNDSTRDPRSENIVINNQSFKPSLVKHGFGYSTFYSKTKEYEAFVKVFVARNDNVKFYEINIKNNLKTKQMIKVDLVLSMVLGVTEELTSRFISSSFDKKNNCLYVENKYNTTFNDASVFVSATEPIIEFNDSDIINKSVTVNVEVEASSNKTFSFMLGCDNVSASLKKYNNEAINNEFLTVTKYWDKLLSTITVSTPDKTFDYALNGWALYQTYASRLLAKAGFYQVGGAIGFRDQLQDVMGVVYSDPSFTRNQILTHAKHQFKEGDVLHWWHEEIMFGSRTKFTDDYLWLVYVTYEYLKVTGDFSILDEKVPFVDGEKLTIIESEKGIRYRYIDEEDTLYGHLKLSIVKALSQMGRHGLPLMGSGDWNDGMNRVGHKGRGESVFVGFFLYDILQKVSAISRKYNDKDFAKLCLEKRDVLGEALKKNAWDGSWYLRAYFDNGDSLGSRNNLECQIDLLCQSWSVISNFAADDKKALLFGEVEKRLVDKQNKIIKLLTPAFKDTNNNPGYIKDYVAGTRENGGQYTHAALWYILALLKDGKADLAYEYYQMINPINRVSSKVVADVYKVEPYVIAADIYSNRDHLGRGGWTWYTGSASWAYKIGLEDILGFNKVGDTLTLNPRINKDWEGYEINYTYLNTKYIIKVENKNHIASGKIAVVLDNMPVKDNVIKLVDDKKEHRVIITMKEDV